MLKTGLEVIMPEPGSLYIYVVTDMISIYRKKNNIQQCQYDAHTIDIGDISITIFLIYRLNSNVSKAEIFD